MQCKNVYFRSQNRHFLQLSGEAYASSLQMYSYNKYNCKKEYIDNVEWQLIGQKTGGINGFYSYSINPNSGLYIVPNYQSTPSPGWSVIYCVSGYKGNSDDWTVLIKYVANPIGAPYEYRKSASTTQVTAPTTFITTVQAIDGTYPDNGLAADGFWYTKSTEVNTSPFYDFGYTGTEQMWTAPQAAAYLIECWGPGFSSTAAGGYSKGIINLSKDTKFKIYVGGQGSVQYGGWNGGGSGGYWAYNNSWSLGGCGATDVRISNGSLNDRIIIAGGAGTGGHGGGDSGSNGSGYSEYGSNYLGGGGGTQIQGGVSGLSNSNGTIMSGQNSVSGSWGNGGKGSDGVGYYGQGSGGGGGYYGGGGGGIGANGGGGSGYISGDSVCTPHSSGYQFTSTIMQSGVNSGPGKVRITIVVFRAPINVISPSENETLIPNRQITERNA